MEIKARIEERISKAQKPYHVVICQLTETYEKLVFLEKAELELLRATSNMNANLKIKLPPTT